MATFASVTPPKEYNAHLQIISTFQKILSKTKINTHKHTRARARTHTQTHTHIHTHTHIFTVSTVLLSDIVKIKVHPSSTTTYCRLKKKLSYTNTSKSSDYCVKITAQQIGQNQSLNTFVPLDMLEIMRYTHS
jgi:hypothetical protein